MFIMKSTKDLNDKNLQNVRLDKSLEKYTDMPLFQDKVNKANETLRTIGLPNTKVYKG
jgi:hypothetical protein